MPAIRTAVLVGERDERLGSVSVPEATMLIEHGGALYYRTATAIRLSGGGVGIIFSYVEPLVREKLCPL